MNDEKKLMPTGIPGLDQLLDGGIIRGNSLLIEGPPGSGKSTLGIRILYEGVVKYNEPGLLITFEEFPRQIYAEAIECGINLQKLQDAGKLRVIWTPPARILHSFHGKNELVNQIIREIEVRRLLIDSITHFKRVSPGETNMREILSGILTHLKIAGINAHLVKELERQDDQTIAFEEWILRFDSTTRERKHEAKISAILRFEKPVGRVIFQVCTHFNSTTGKSKCFPGFAPKM